MKTAIPLSRDQVLSAVYTILEFDVVREMTRAEVVQDLRVSAQVWLPQRPELARESLRLAAHIETGEIEFETLHVGKVRDLYRAERDAIGAP